MGVRVGGGALSQARGGRETGRAPFPSAGARPVPLYTHVLLLDRALAAVVRVRHPDGPADDAAALERAKAALVAHAHERVGPDVRVAHGALAVAALAQAADGCFVFVVVMGVVVGVVVLKGVR